MTDDDAQRIASWHLLELLQQPSQSQDARSEFFATLLSLEAGFWQRTGDFAPKTETLKGYILRVARQAIAQFVQCGIRPTAVDPQDLCQDLLLDFFRLASSIRENPRGWFVGVAVRKLRGLMRAEGKYLIADRIVDEPQSEPQKVCTPVQESRSEDRSDTSRRVRRAVKKLPKTARVVLTAHLAGKTTREIAIDLNEADATIRQRLSRGRRALQELLRRRA